MADLLQITTPGVEFRAGDSGRNITGPVVRYGDVARTKRGLERVAAGAMLGLNDPALAVNLQHRLQPSQRIATVGDGLLTFTDGPTALRADLAVPEGDVGTAAIEGVQSGELTGWSSEFLPLIEAAEGGINTVFRALAVGLGLVAVPAYAGSRVQLRQDDENLLLTGPPGAGKSQRAMAILAETPGGILSDFQTNYASILGISRNSDTGRFPERRPEDAHALRLAEYLRVATIGRAVESGLFVITTNSVGSLERRNQLLELLGGPGRAREEVIDPGREVVEQRLVGPDGNLSGQCEEAIRRYYDSLPRSSGPRRRSKELAWL